MLSFSSSDLESTKVDNSLNIFTKFNPLTTFACHQLERFGFLLTYQLYSQNL